MTKKKSFNNLARDCGGNRYKGFRKPRCCGGQGCQTCWSLYIQDDSIFYQNKEKKNFTQTDFTVILDRSGSMYHIAREMTEGLQDLVKDQQKLADECNFTLVQFDGSHETIVDCMPIQQVPEHLLKLNPRGITALYDTIGHVILNTKERLLKQQSKPGKILFYIITDGLNNASRTYDKHDIKKMIQECEADDWQFTYLGENAVRVAAQIGIKSTHTSNYSYTGQGTKSVFQTTSNKLRRIRAEKDCNADLGKITQLTPEELKKLVA